MGSKVSLSCWGTSKLYTPKSLGILASQEPLLYLLLKHIPHLKQQTTPEERFLVLGNLFFDSDKCFWNLIASLFDCSALYQCHIFDVFSYPQLSCPKPPDVLYG